MEVFINVSLVDGILYFTVDNNGKEAITVTFRSAHVDATTPKVKAGHLLVIQRAPNGAKVGDDITCTVTSGEESASATTTIRPPKSK